MIVAWWSGGITSAVACKKALDNYENVKLIYIETGSHHPDTLRFKKDCEDWYKTQIDTIQSKYTDHWDVIKKNRYINGPTGAKCTAELKRRVREKWEKINKPSGYVWGFESGAREEGRAQRIQTAQPNVFHYFPLIEANLTKKDCINIVSNSGIEIPIMYKLGFHNNNCIGCVKGGMAYWNLIRKHFPEVFEKGIAAEAEVGRTMLRKYALKDLPLDVGRGEPPLVQECGATGEGCVTELSRQYHQRD